MAFVFCKRPLVNEVEGCPSPHCTRPETTACSRDSLGNKRVGALADCLITWGKAVSPALHLNYID